ncbi:HupE/UreJ family protein [Rhizorhabdus argentea]|uniref:HupE/UreJ family protein n=1 Tax=Rhizorhabdus argentea TaxID=1387174 RepID=UPI0030EB1E25
MNVARLLLALICLLAGMAPASAHDAFPLLINVRQAGGALFSVDLRLPPSYPEPFKPSVQIDKQCTRVAGAGHDGGTDLYRCPRGLGGALRLIYPGSAPAVPGLVRISWASGESRSLLLKPGETRVALPQPESRAGVAGQYLRLGIEHILTGFDHLLFLICLLWLAGGFRRILLTITGFTVAHSITLALSALGWVEVAVPPVEAAIALSIVFLAVEIYKGSRDTLSWRYPIVVSSSFGLLHGFGFAAVLGQIGLPQTELVTGLLFFNIGVEIGQLIFVMAAITLYLILRKAWAHMRLRANAPVIMRHASAAVVGTLASYWLVERTVALFG